MLPDIQILRAIAILSVLWAHVDFWLPFRPTWLNESERQGVYLFFTLSGFVITKTLYKHGLFNGPEQSFATRLPKQWPILKAYAIRRFFRLAPVTITGLVLLGASSYFLRATPNPLVTTPQMPRLILHVLTFTTDLARWNDRAWGGAFFNDYGLWSLAAEERAYLLTALISIICIHGNTRLKTYLVFIISAHTLHALYAPWLQSAYPLSEFYYFSPFITFAQFSAGCLAFFLYQTHSTHFTRTIQEWVRDPRFLPFTLLSFIAILLLSFTLFALLPYAPLAYLCTFFLSPILVLLATTPHGLVPHNLLRTFLLGIGNRSFVLYLTHYPVLHILHTGTAHGWIASTTLAQSLCFTLLLLGLCELIHRGIEKPWIRRAHSISGTTR